MNCPRCGSDKIRRSQSQDSVWFRFVLQKMMRCQRCCHAFASPLWGQPATPATAVAEMGESVEETLVAETATTVR
jgi:hypothetical protein